MTVCTSDLQCLNGMMGCFRRLRVNLAQTGSLSGRQRFIHYFSLLSFDQEAEDGGTVASPPAVSEKSVKTGEKGTSPAPPVIKLETSHAALDNVSLGKMARV